MRWFYSLVHWIGWQMSAFAMAVSEYEGQYRITDWFWYHGGALEYWADNKLWEHAQHGWDSHTNKM
jgi:hypothetical protein